MGPLGSFLKLELTRLQPGTTLGTSPVSSSLVPAGSPPRIGVNGCPVLALYKPTSCHPPNAHSGSFEPFRGPGISQVALRTRVCATLKSESPRVVFVVKENLVEKPVRKRVIGFRGRKRINALAPGVRAVELNAVADALGHVHLHGIVKRVRLPERGVDPPKIRVDLGAGTSPSGRKPAWQVSPRPSGPQGHM